MTALSPVIEDYPCLHPPRGVEVLAEKMVKNLGFVVKTKKW
jgi:hypothetical protein